MSLLDLPGIEHVPKDRNGLIILISTLIGVSCFAVAIIRDHLHHRERRHYSTPRVEVARILGRTALEAPADRGVRWSITKGGLLLFKGQIKASPGRKTKERLDALVLEMTAQINETNRQSDRSIRLEGIQIDTFYATRLWEESVLTYDHFANSHNRDGETEIDGVIFGNVKLQLYIRDEISKLISPPRFRISGHPHGSLIDKLRLPLRSELCGGEFAL
jgi:hypothetical protein